MSTHDAATLATVFSYPDDDNVISPLTGSSLSTSGYDPMISLETPLTYDDSGATISPLLGGSASSLTFLSPSTAMTITASPYADAPTDPAPAPGTTPVPNVQNPFPSNGYWPGDPGYGYNPGTSPETRLTYDPPLGTAGLKQTGDQVGGDYMGGIAQAGTGVPEINYDDAGGADWQPALTAAIGAPWYQQVVGTLNTNMYQAFTDLSQDIQSWGDFMQNWTTTNLYNPQLVAEGWKELANGTNLACTTLASSVGLFAVAADFSKAGKTMITAILTGGTALQNLVGCIKGSTNNYSVMPDLAERSALIDAVGSLFGADRSAYNSIGSVDPYNIQEVGQSPIDMDGGLVIGAPVQVHGVNIYTPAGAALLNTPGYAHSFTGIPTLASAHALVLPGMLHAG